VQPLLPTFSAAFKQSPAQSSLVVSVATLTLGVAMLAAGSISGVLGRKRIMLISLICSSVLVVLTALSPDFTVLLVLRALEGIALAGLPAVAMGYLTEEVDRDSLGIAMGLYISGNSIGGLLGRVLTGFLTGLVSWRGALLCIGVLGFLASAAFWRMLPEARHFQARPADPRRLVLALASNLTDRGLRYLFAMGALLLGSFVILYNYLGYRLESAPYNLSQSAASLIFVAYLFGTFSSAWMGALSTRYGRRPILVAGVLIMLCGLGLTLFAPLPLIIAGVILFTFGFFGSHSIASSWVGARSMGDSAQAASLYLLFYYLGSSVCGYGGGFVWARFAWPGVATLICLILVCALTGAVRLSRLPSRQGVAVQSAKLDVASSAA
jgi:YNFM family putative membrane transporter